MRVCYVNIEANLGQIFSGQLIKIKYILSWYILTFPYILFYQH